jgi:phosphoribosylamine-glycine ligase
MFIKQITIEGVEGDVEIAHTDEGALVTAGNRVLCAVRRDEDREKRFWKAYEVARLVCGESRDRRTGERVPNATNSMIHEVLAEIERIAGC